jgi:hypothetical protein
MLRFDAIQRRKYENYFRYVDDILLICKTSTADETLKAIGRSLSSTRGLVIHKKGVAGKTEISPVVEGVDFLGYRICPDKVSIRDSSFRRMFKNILKVITEYRYRQDTDRLVFRLNLKITGCTVDGRRRGWMMFFSHTEDMSQLSHLDAFVKQQLNRVDVPRKEQQRIKRFIKAYHEIRYNITLTGYIPNLDKFTRADKVEAVAALSPYSIEEVANWEDEYLDLEFSRRMSKEVHDLEQDVGNPS